MLLRRSNTHGESNGFHLIQITDLENFQGLLGPGVPIDSNLLSTLITYPCPLTIVELKLPLTIDQHSDLG